MCCAYIHNCFVLIELDFYSALHQLMIIVLGNIFKKEAVILPAILIVALVLICILLVLGIIAFL